MGKWIADDTDIEILETLSSDVRGGSKRIGDALGLRRQVVEYRIRRMEENGAIAGYRMMGNLSKLGFEYKRVHVKFSSADRKKREQALMFLANHRKAVWVVDCDGRYDLLVGFVAEGQHDFNGTLSDFLTRFHGIIAYYDIAHVLEVATPARDFSGTNHMRPIQGYVVGDFPGEEASELDKKIVNELTRNGRQTAMQIAKKVHAEPANVNYHIKQILKKGLVFSNIQFGYGVFGFQLYKTLLYLKNPDKGRLGKLKQFARSQPRIWNYIETLGRWQVEFDIESRGHEDYYRIMDAVQDNFSDIVASYDTIYIRKEWKFSFDIF